MKKSLGETRVVILQSPLHRSGSIHGDTHNCNWGLRTASKDLGLFVRMYLSVRCQDTTQNRTLNQNSIQTLIVLTKHKDQSQVVQAWDVAQWSFQRCEFLSSFFLPCWDGDFSPHLCCLLIKDCLLCLGASSLHLKQEEDKKKGHIRPIFAPWAGNQSLFRSKVLVTSQLPQFVTKHSQMNH